MWLRVHKAALRAGAVVVREKSPADALAAIPKDASRVALLWDGIDLAAGRAFAGALAGFAELSTYIASEQGNARGAEAMGMLPAFGPGYAAADRTGKDARAMFSAAERGELSALSIFGANPVEMPPAEPRSRPRSRRFRSSSSAISSSPRRRRLRHWCFRPRRAREERHDPQSCRRSAAIEAALEAPDGVLNDFDMIAGLAERFDVALPGRELLDATVIANAARIPDAIAFGDERFASGDTAAEDAPAAVILSGGGTWRHDPTLAALRDGAAASQAVGAPA